MAKAIYRSPTQPGNFDMLLFIVLVLLVMLTQSLIAFVATEVGSTFDAAVAMAGLFSFIGLFGYIFWSHRATGGSVGWSQRGVAVADGHFEITDHVQQDIAVSPVGRRMAGSSLVRSLVLAKDDPAKRRIRARLSDIDDVRLSGLGLTSEDIAALRGTAIPPAEANIVSQISPSIAASLDATDAAPESDPPRRERASNMLAA
jgi:ABC-type multidrug transport system fused ATPase/permease subunit